MLHLNAAVKTGVQQLIQYYNEKEANTPPPETTKEGLGSTSNVSDMVETTTMAPLVLEVVNSAPSWGWPLVESYDLNLGNGNFGI